MTRFADGNAVARLDLGAPPNAALAGTVELLSNATVTSGFVRVSGAPYDLPASFTDTPATGFQNGSLTAGLYLGPAAMRLASRNGTVEFAGPALDAGTFVGTARVGDRIELVGASGNYTTPSIPFDGTSYGRVIANLSGGVQGAVTVDVLGAGGEVLATGLGSGDLVPFNGSLSSSIRLRATMTGGPYPVGPWVARLGVGYVLADYWGPGGPARTLSGVTNFAGSLENGESLLNFTEYEGNPVLGGTPSTWHAGGPILGNALSVGAEVWLYFDAEGVGGHHIGRMVSGDGGLSWSVDAAPMLNQSAGEFDGGFIGSPSVIRDGGSFKMWFFGSDGSDAFRVGYATSPDGISWTKYAGNPVMAPSVSGWDDWNVGWPRVVKVDSTYYMFYAGRRSDYAPKQIGLATSTDGIAWTKSASNPVVGWSTISAADYDLNPNDVLHQDGRFVLYWMCAHNAASYDTCVSTSTDGVSWTHYYRNPILTHGDGTWDDLTNELSARTVDPVTGHARLFYSARPGSLEYSMGRADPSRDPGEGEYTALWDLRGEVPAGFGLYSLDHTLAPSASLGPSVESSTDNVSFSAPESLAIGGGNISTPADHYLRHTVTLSAADLRFSASLHGARIAYERYTTSGSFQSAATPQPYPIRSATVTVAGDIPGGTSVALWLSNDGGSVWWSAPSGAAFDFPSTGTQFRYRLVFEGTSAASPQVTAAFVSLQVTTAPEDVSLSLDGSGPEAARFPGLLSAPRTAVLDPALFNARLAPFASYDPPVLVPIGIIASSGAGGTVLIEQIRLNVTYPDLLNVTFLPPGNFVLLEEGESAAFEAIATTTPGVAITYAWQLDGAPAGTGPRFDFEATSPTVGNHTVFASVSNGEFTREHRWNMSVLENPAYLRVLFYPDVHEIDVPAGSTQQFFAAVASAVYTATLQWSVDGAAEAAQEVDTTTSVFEFQAPPTPGAHLVSCTVTNGHQTFVWWWNITVTAQGTPSRHQLRVVFDPDHDVLLEIGAEQAFYANVSRPAPPGLLFSWWVDGVLSRVVDGALLFRANASSVGNHTVEALVTNGTALATHRWAVVVLPPGPTISIVSPLDNSNASAARVLVTGVATPGARVFLAGNETQADGAGHFAANVTLVPGRNALVARAVDGWGREARAQVNVTFAPQPPPPPPPNVVTGETRVPAWAWMLLLAVLLGVGVVLWRRALARGPPPTE